MGADPSSELLAEPGALDGVRFAVVDVETSGLKTGSHRLLQIGLVMTSADGTIIDRWSTFVRPRWWRIARVGPTEIHGISRREPAPAPTLAEVYDELAPRLDGAVVTAHNVAFDWAFLQRGAERRAGSYPPASDSARCSSHARSIPPTSGPTDWPTCASATACTTPGPTTRSPTPRPRRRSSPTCCARPA